MTQFKSLFILLLVTAFSFGQTCVNCNTPFDGGTIAADQNGYNPYDANLLTSTADANGGTANVEYVWMTSIVNTPNTAGNTSWSPVPNSNSTTLDPGTLTETTFYIRCARIIGCQNYFGESNMVTITVNEDPCTEAFDGGVIAADQTGFSPYDANVLTSVQDAVNPNGAVEYVWMMSTQNVPNTVGNSAWAPIPNSNSATLDPGTLTDTTYYIRCARLVGCSNYWGESNMITIIVSTDPCTEAFDGGIIVADQTGFSPYDANVLTSVQDAINPNGAVEYVWMMSTQNVPNTPGNTAWSPVPNSNSATLDPGTLTQTTYYIRCARLVGCTNYWGESNMITITVNNPQPVTGCLVYAVHDEGQFDHSQLFTIDPYSGNTVAALGQPHLGLDLEGLEIHPITGMMYGTSGNDNLNGDNGHFYRIDAVTGEVFPVGPTGYDDVVSLAFHPITNALYAWCDDYGLLTIDLITGAGTMVIPSTADMDGLAFDPTGTKLYGMDNDELFLINLSNNSISFLAGNFGGTIESLEARPDGLLYFGMHGAGTTTMFAYDPLNLVTVSTEDIPANPYHDIEGIAWPDGCSFIIDGEATFTSIQCNGDLTDIDLTMLYGNPPYSCVWSSGEITEDLTQVTAGTYTVTVTDANGLVYTETIVVDEPAPLSLVFTNQNPSSGFSSDGMIDLTINGGTPAYLAQWDNGSVGTFQAMLSTGTYNVTVEDDNGCVVTGSTTLTCGSNINTNLNFASQVSVYPQPATISDVISIEIATEKVEVINFRVLDLNGNVLQVLNEMETLAAKQSNGIVRIQNLPTGVYLLELNNGDSVQTERVIVR